MKKIEAIIRVSKFEDVKAALKHVGIVMLYIIKATNEWIRNLNFVAFLRFIDGFCIWKYTPDYSDYSK